jgi:hypothetical protein
MAATASGVAPNTRRSRLIRWLFATILLATIGPFLLAIIQYMAGDTNQYSLWVTVFGKGELFLASTFLVGSSLPDIVAARKDDDAAFILTVVTFLFAVACVELWSSEVARKSPSFQLSTVVGLIFVVVAAGIAGLGVYRRWPA